jgi:VanZ family protein
MISFIFSFKPWLRKTIGAIYLLVIALLSLLPSYDIPDISLFPGADKLVHICMYLGLAFLACWVHDIGHHRIWFIYLLLAGVFMYGVLMEILQRTMHNGRDFDFKDLLANLTGAIIGLLIYKYLDRLRMKMAVQTTGNRVKGESTTVKG